MPRPCSPASFIPVAESSRLIVSLGEWVLRMACEDLRHILDSDMDRFRMAVNVSIAQFGRPLFLEMLDAISTETGVPAANLELEITEPMAMLDLGYVVQTLAALKPRGITVAVDDFGTGFSSLSYLARMHLDRLDLEQYFVRQSALSTDCAYIAETIVELGRRLNLV